MSEETRLVLQAVIGVLVAVVVAFVTSWLNRKYFREQLGEQRYFEVYLDKMLDLWGEVFDIYLGVIELIGEMAVAAEEMRGKGHPQSRIDSEVTRIYGDKLPPILIKTVALNKHYILLSRPAIKALREFQRILTVKMRKPGQRSFDEFKPIVVELNDCFARLFHQLRSEFSNLSKRETTVSEILAMPIDAGDLVPPHVMEGLSAEPSRES